MNDTAEFILTTGLNDLESEVTDYLSDMITEVDHREDMTIYSGVIDDMPIMHLVDFYYLCEWNDPDHAKLMIKPAKGQDWIEDGEWITYNPVYGSKQHKILEEIFSGPESIGC